MINIDEGKYWDLPWNWVSGCDDELECYERCWARAMANRQRGRNGYPKNEPFSVTFHPNMLTADKPNYPLRRKSPAVYATFMGDPFHRNVRRSWIKKAIFTVKTCPQHVYIWLTKRPENIPVKLFDCGVLKDGLPNLIIGVSVERPEYLDRISALKEAWAGPNLISFEPLLEDMGDIAAYLTGIDAVIIGGESGPKARPMHPDWARNIIEQCEKAEVPVYFKQWGVWITSYDAGYNSEELDD